MIYVRTVILFLCIVSVFMFTSCPGRGGSPSSDKELTSFIFEAVNNTDLSSDKTGTIDGTSITIDVPIGTDFTALVATFTTTGVSVTVDSTEQVSGTTPNNFINTVTYTVIAEDDSTQDYTVAVGREDMVEVPENTGGFSMGYAGVAVPVHTVAGISSFTMNIYETTYALWTDIKTWAESNGYTFTWAGTQGDGTDDTDLHPVTEMNWHDAVVWCNALSEKEGLTPVYYHSGQAHTSGNVYRDSTAVDDIGSTDVEWDAHGYRLPTEAEWEYAARYIDGTSFMRGDAPSGWTDDNPANGSVDDAEIDAVAWWNNNSDSSTHEVGTRAPDALGLYDMSGNVWEWCWDWYDLYTTESPYTDTDPKGPDTGNQKVQRSGDAWDTADYMRVCARDYWDPDDDPPFDELGFRIVRRVP